MINEVEFECRDCDVWVTGRNLEGLLGTGDFEDVQGFRKVSEICFEQISLKWITSLAVLGNKTYWAGLQSSLTYPTSGTNILAFDAQSNSGKYGFSCHNLIKFYG